MLRSLFARLRQFPDYYAGVILFFLVLTLVTVTLSQPLRLNHDSTMYLEIARYLLEGQTPYVDFKEINPPLIYYISVIPVVLSRLSGLNPITWYLILVLGLVVYSVMMTRYLMSRRVEESSSLQINIASIMLVLVSLGTPMSFGQREHLLILTVIPWLVLRSLRVEGYDIRQPVALLTGVLAAIGLAVKPHYVLALVLVEGFWLIRYRRWRVLFSTETLVVIGIGLAYAGHFLVVPATMRQAFFGELLPSVASSYGAYSRTAPSTLWHWLLRPLFLFPGVFWFGVMGVAVLLRYRLPKRATSRLVLPLTIFAGVSFGIYVFQDKGWEYHALPFLATVFVLYGAGIIVPLAARLRDRTGGTSSRRWLLKIALVLVSVPLMTITGMLLFLSFQQSRLAAPTALEQVIDRYSQPGDSVFFVSTGVTPAFPTVVAMNRESNMTYPVAYPIAFGLFPEASPAMLSGEEPLPAEIADYLTILAVDIRTHQPPLIFIERGCEFCPEGFSVHRLLEASGFIEAHLRPEYERLPETAGVDFVVYRRTVRLTLTMDNRS